MIKKLIASGLILLSLSSYSIVVTDEYLSTIEDNWLSLEPVDAYDFIPEDLAYEVYNSPEFQAKLEEAGTRLNSSLEGKDIALAIDAAASKRFDNGQKGYKVDNMVNLTSSDRSVIYALLAANTSISAIEKDNKKSWWKKKLLSDYYYFDSLKHILINNLEPLSILQIKHDYIQNSIKI